MSYINEMTKYERLVEHATSLGCIVHEEYDLGQGPVKGLYLNGHIALDQSMTSSEKRCVLCEEIGHHATSYGNILDLSLADNRKQERKARIYAFDHLIGLSGLVRAYKAGCQNAYEAALYLDVCEAFLLDAIEYYGEKHGTHVYHNGYMIYFNPFKVKPLYVDQRRKTY